MMAEETAEIADELSASVKTRSAGRRSKANSATPEPFSAAEQTNDQHDGAPEDAAFHMVKDEIAGDAGSNSGDDIDTTVTTTPSAGDANVLSNPDETVDDDLLSTENELDESVASNEDSPTKQVKSSPNSLNGQEPTIRNFIFAAIGVMKNRGARPDTKRICNWIHRRYGHPIQSVSDELERLVQIGELARVDYKGSASFRIVNMNGKVKRKRRSVNKMSPPKNTSVGFVTAEVGHFETPTLRTLVLDLLAESGVTIIEPTTTITSKFITRAVQGTQRHIPKAAMLENFDSILAKEVECGNFSRIADDEYRLPPDGTPYEPPAPQPIPNGALPVTQQAMIVPTNSLTPPVSGSFSQPFTFPMRTTQAYGYDQGSATPPIQSPGNGSTPSLSLIESIKQPLVRPPPPPISPMSVPASSVRGTPGLAPMTSLTPPPGMARGVPYQTDATLTITGITSNKSDEERKNDLINEKLFKLTSSIGSKNKASPTKAKQNEFHLTLKENLRAGKTKKGKTFNVRRSQESIIEPTTIIKTEPDLEEPPQLRVNRTASKDSASSHESFNESETLTEDSEHKPLVGMKRKKKRLEYKEEPSLQFAISNMRGGRKKFSRKIFDPADHEQPTRKRPRVPSPLSSAGIEAAASADVIPTDGVTIKAENVCAICYKACDTTSPKKGVKPDQMLRCVDCSSTVHPSCMDYSEELIKKVMGTEWQCTGCKTCHMCLQAYDDDYILVCDSCDLGFHMECHRPPLTKAPTCDKWECFKCSPQLPPPPAPPTKSRTVSRNIDAVATPIRVTHSIGQENITNGFHANKVKKDVSSSNRFVPILPPHMHPHTGVLPDNWEDFELDPTIPDVSNWNAKKIHEYFLSHGFSQDVCQTLLEQEIDGGSLLLLHRNDVLTSLGLKLGPALKVFKHVKRLQTRRHFPNH